MHGISLKNVHFTYNNQPILEDINLTLTCKDFLVIIGPNGGGKTTLLKLILGLLEPSSGHICVFGKTPKKAQTYSAYVPQNTNINLNFPITVFEIVLMGRLNKKCFSFFSKKDKYEASKALDEVQMSQYKNVHIGNLSGGQRQRVFIARALSTNARFLFLDEPTASIDTNGQIQIFELLKELNKKVGIALISHDVNIALGYANKIAHINKKLFMHNIPDLKTKEALQNSFQKINGHLCPVEIVSQTICTHNMDN